MALTFSGLALGASSQPLPRMKPPSLAHLFYEAVAVLVHLRGGAQGEQVGGDVAVDADAVPDDLLGLEDVDWPRRTPPRRIPAGKFPQRFEVQIPVAVAVQDASLSRPP